MTADRSREQHERARSLPVYGVDPDRTQTTDLVTVIRRRIEGRYPVDPFGADPQLQDLIAPFVTATRARGRRPPRAAPATTAPRCSCRTAASASSSRPRSRSRCARRSGRRLRVIGAPDVPSSATCMRKLGAVMSYQGDLAALLRAEHVAALPLGPTWLRTGAGTPPIQLLVAALGYPVIPVAVRPGGPFGLPIRPWRVPSASRSRCAATAARATRSPRPSWPKPRARACSGCSTASESPRRLPRVRADWVTVRGLRWSSRSRASRSRQCGWHEGGFGVGGRRRGRRHDPLRRLRPPRRPAAAADPGPRHRLAGLGAPAARLRAPLPLLRARQPRHRPQRPARRARTRSTGWRSTRSPCSTPRASTGPT